MLERKVDADGAEKVYNTLTGEEVKLITSPEEVALEHLPPQSQSESPGRRGEPSAAETVRGWCCTGGCAVCQDSDTTCRGDNDCNKFYFVSLWSPLHHGHVGGMHTSGMKLTQTPQNIDEDLLHAGGQAGCKRG